MNVPEPNKEYPIRLGRSMLSGATHSHFTMRFPHVPDVLDSGSGTMHRTGSEVNLLAPRVGGGCVSMSGVAAMRSPSTSTGEYLLVFHEGVFWLERCTAGVHNLREVEAKDPNAELPTVERGDPEQPHEQQHQGAWTPPDFVVSPLTHMLSSDEEEDRASGQGLISTPTPTPPALTQISSEDTRASDKNVKRNDKPPCEAATGESESEKNNGSIQSENKFRGMQTRGMKATAKAGKVEESDGEDSGSDSGSSQSGSESEELRKQAEPEPVAAFVAHKQLATKSLPPRVGCAARAGNEDKGEESSSFESDDSSDSDLDSFTDASSIVMMSSHSGRNFKVSNVKMSKQGKIFADLNLKDSANAQTTKATPAEKSVVANILVLKIPPGLAGK